MRNKTDIHRVALALMPNAPMFETAVPCEVFGIARPELSDPWYELLLCATEPRARLAHGFVTDSPLGLDELAGADTVIVPACADVNAHQPSDLVAAVAEAHRRGARVAGLCSGAFVLAQAGLLDGRRATTHWMHADQLRRRFPRVVVDESVIYTEQDRIFTSAGTAAAIDLCLELVRRDRGTGVANGVARRMVTPPHRSADQAQYIAGSIPPVRSAALGSAVDWARERLDEPIGLGELASRAHLSERQLSRRFVDAFGLTPGRWLARERLRHAQDLLETTNLTVETIARRSGFESAAGLRAAFARRLNTSPSEYRAAWSPRG